MNTITLPDSLDLLPTKDVAMFVASLAQDRGITYQFTKLDAWAATITHLSDDEVYPDATCDLLVALARAKVLDGRQMGRLLTNHLREIRHLLPK